MMKKITNKKLSKIIGGTTITSLTLTAALLNSFSKIIEIVYEIGSGFGSSVRRLEENNSCTIK